MHWAIDTNALKHMPMKTKKSDPKRIQFVCTEPGCAFVFAARQGADGVFHLSSWSWHSCDEFTNPKVKGSWLKEQAKAALARNETTRPKDLERILREDNGVSIENRAAVAALYNARKENDIEDAAFEKIPGFFRALQALNDRTVAEVVLDDGHFSMAFLCPENFA